MLCDQLLRLCVKVCVVPSEYVTVNVCEGWLPSTPNASMLREVNEPGAKDSVVLDKPLGRLGGAYTNVVPFQVTEEPMYSEDCRCTSSVDRN